MNRAATIDLATRIIGRNIRFVNPPVAKTAIGKPIFKASDGGCFERVGVTENSIKSGLQQGPETPVLVEQEVRPEPFPSGLPMSV